MKRISRMCLTCVVLIAAMFSFAVGGVFAQGYPQKPIRFIVPYAAGGSTDLATRIVGEKLSEILGQPVLIENKPGADGNIGLDIVAKAPPDGYTIVMGTIHLTVAPHLSKLPYDVQKDFAPILFVNDSPSFIAVHPSVPAKSLADLIKLAKSKPGKLNYGTSGVAQAGHLAGELFKMKAGIDMMHVPFKGSGEAVKSLLGGHVEVGINSVPSALPHVQAETLRALAITFAKRSPLTPDVPTLVELGYDIVTGSWNGVLAPAGTPKQIVNKLNTEIGKILKMPDVRKRMQNQGLEPNPTSTPEEFTAYIMSETVRWGEVLRAAGVIKK